MAAVAAFTLTRSPPRVVRIASAPSSILGYLEDNAEICQANEVLPAGAFAVRLSMLAYVGARLRVTATSGARVLAEGRRGPDWTGTSVTVPLSPVADVDSRVRLCVNVGPNGQSIFFLGTLTSPSAAAVDGAGRALAGRLGVEYLGPGRGSWWSRILSVARHMGIGHALSGTWVVLLIAALVASAGVLSIGLVLRELS